MCAYVLHSRDANSLAEQNLSNKTRGSTISVKHRTGRSGLHNAVFAAGRNKQHTLNNNGTDCEESTSKPKIKRYHPY